MIIIIITIINYLTVVVVVSASTASSFTSVVALIVVSFGLLLLLDKFSIAVRQCESNAGQCTKHTHTHTHIHTKQAHESESETELLGESFSLFSPSSQLTETRQQHKTLPKIDIIWFLLLLPLTL